LITEGAGWYSNPVHILYSVLTTLIPLGQNATDTCIPFTVTLNNHNEYNCIFFTAPHSSTPPPAKRGTGRPRGRPKGSGVGRRPRGRGSVQKALSAAEIAGAQAGKSAAYAAYGYNFTGKVHLKRYICDSYFFQVHMYVVIE